MTGRPHPDHDEDAEWWDAAVPAHLTGLVTSVVGYRRLDGPTRVHRGLPSGAMTLIVNVGEPVRILDGSGADRFDTTIAGLHTRPTLIDDTGTQEGVSIGLHPLGVGALLGAPAAALVDAAVELDDVVGSGGRRLWERLQEPATARARTEVCIAWLGERIARADERRVDDGVRRAWSVLDRSAGQVRVDRLADDIGWSRQHLRRRFRAELGLNPKESARVLRFDASVRRLKARPATELAGLAAECGFADQSHLTNEWGRLAGCSPTDWLTTDLVPNVQDRDGLRAAR